jgi:hypothetical protein
MIAITLAFILLIHPRTSGSRRGRHVAVLPSRPHAAADRLTRAGRVHGVQLFARRNFYTVPSSCKRTTRNVLLRETLPRAVPPLIRLAAAESVGPYPGIGCAHTNARRSGDMGTTARSTERPAEAADSLTPRPEWARPIDPDAADRRRYGTPNSAASPDLLRVKRAGDEWPLRGLNRDRWLRPVGEPRRVVGSPQATRWPGPVARTPCGRRAVGRRASRPAA